MEKMFVRLEGVHITWRGDLERKDKVTGAIVKKSAAQGFTTVTEGGKATHYDFGGVSDQVRSLEVGEVVGVDCAVKTWNGGLYVDILKVHRASEKGQGVGSGKRVM